MKASRVCVIKTPYRDYSQAREYAIREIIESFPDDIVEILWTTCKPSPDTGKPTNVRVEYRLW